MTAAVLFGAGTPLAKLLLTHTSPWLLAALLYLGSGIGLWIRRLELVGRSDRGRRHGRTGAADAGFVGDAGVGRVAAVECRGRTHGAVGLVSVQGKLRPQHHPVAIKTDRLFEIERILIALRDRGYGALCIANGAWNQ